MHTPKLAKSIGPWQLWGVAVGLVISGMYFGWSYGWGQAGTLGFFITTLLVAQFYITFVLCYTELGCAIPQAGGPFVYCERAWGKPGAIFAGSCGLISYLLVPPTVALAIGDYFNNIIPLPDPALYAAIAFLIFTSLNIIGVSIAVTFEFVITVLAIIELLVFAGIVAPEFSWNNVVSNGWLNHSVPSWDLIYGILGGLPFAIWFFFGIEGAAMVAEETRNPGRNVPKAFLSAILTLTALAFIVMIMAAGVGDWQKLAKLNDPLPIAMKSVVGENSGWTHMLIYLGMLGLIASFHAFILSGSRQVFALSRSGYMPSWFNSVHPRWKTPHRAILAQGFIGLAILPLNWILKVYFDVILVEKLVTLSVLSVLLLYAVSLNAQYRLRKIEPSLPRPYVTPGFPFIGYWSLAWVIVFFLSIALLNLQVSLLFLITLTLVILCMLLSQRKFHRTHMSK